MIKTFVNAWKVADIRKKLLFYSICYPCFSELALSFLFPFLNIV